jgi:protoheme IX farnesyltransferase
MFKLFADLTKFGIVVFVLLSGLAGYATSFAVERPFELQHLLNFFVGLFFLSSGSLALNQYQEWPKDKLMPRTSKRPIASGKIKPAAALILSLAFLFTGAALLHKASPLANYLGLLTVVLYNGLYTYWWKPKWIFAAVPGAIPGALPVTIGYAANSSEIFSLDSIYLFLIMFLWQMPHFWALAVKYKDDYAEAGVPTMPVAIGLERTMFHMGLYSFVYVAIAVLSPAFVHASWLYLAITIPIGAKILIEFFRFRRSQGQANWLKYFIWINLSLLIFLFVPVFDKWGGLIWSNLQ